MIKLNNQSPLTKIIRFNQQTTDQILKTIIKIKKTSDEFARFKRFGKKKQSSINSGSGGNYAGHIASIQINSEERVLMYF